MLLLRALGLRLMAWCLSCRRVGLVPSIGPSAWLWSQWPELSLRVTERCQGRCGDLELEVSTYEVVVPLDIITIRRRAEEELQDGYLWWCGCHLSGCLEHLGKERRLL